MYNHALLNTEVQYFIRDFEGDIHKLAFAGSPFKNISVPELIQQIESRKKAKEKLPTWFKTPNIIFPPKINLEQTSSEITAHYKASLVSGESMADITGGFGVDSYFFSEKFKIVNHFEINSALSEIASHNFIALNRKNIECHNQDGLEAVLQRKYDVIYADPSRRHDTKGKVFFLKDCEPDIPKNISAIMQNCESLLLKTSPMLDLTVGLNELGNVAEIHILAVDNEVKELVWLIKNTYQKPTSIRTVNFEKRGRKNFHFTWEESAEATFSLPQKYLFEPNAAIMKSGAFDLISEKLKLPKLHKNTHLYTGSELVDFPGRRFLIENIVSYNKREMRAALNFGKANITTRNFPESVETLRKKWKVAEGGSIYLFFVTNSEGKKAMLICSKV